MQELNTNILIKLHSLLDYPIIENLSLILSDIPIFFLPIFLVIAWIYYTYKDKNIKRKKDLLFIFYGCAIALIVNLTIQGFVDMDRPESALEGSNKLLLDHIPNASFPSDHSAVSMAFVIGLFLARFNKIGIVYGILAILMALSRVILGVHWPFDILGGWIVGILGALISFKILKGTNLFNKINDFLLKIANYLKL